MKVSELAERAGIASSAVRWYESAGVIPPAIRQPNGYREYAEQDLARLRLVVSLRRLGLGPEDAGRMARLCLERGEVDRDLAPLIADQRAALARQRDDLDRLDGELIDLEATIAAAGRARSTRKELPMSEAPIRVLFVCTGNSARSQIAEAVLGRIGGADFEVFSAGVEPKGVNPFTIRVLDDAGIDWSQAHSKSVDEFLGQPFDYVITVCDRARQACPIFPGVHNTLHWGLEDPAEVEGTDAQKLAAFQRTYMEVNQRIRPFVEVALRAAGRTRRSVIAG
jgi:arsenate reductase